MKQPIRIHYFQHITFEELGYIETWAEQNEHQLSATKFYDSEQFPKLQDFDWLIVMGGPMGVNEEQEYPWLKPEKAFILQAIRAQKTVIGICLGAQLIAAALGAKVYPGKKKEIGWFPLSKTAAGKANVLLDDLPEQFTAFHWHGDTFDLPNGAIHLLQTVSCPNQAFLYNESVLGLQFHFEVTPQTLSAMTKHCRHELIPNEFIQTEQEILYQAPLSQKCNELLRRILDKLVVKPNSIVSN